MYVKWQVFLTCPSPPPPIPPSIKGPTFAPAELSVAIIGCRIFSIKRWGHLLDPRLFERGVYSACIFTKARHK